MSADMLRERMALDWSCGALAEGLRCYRSEEFFEAHEHWETAWLACAEPEKTFLQSLIQVSAAFHHLRRGNAIGATSLLTRALLRLGRFPEVYGGIEVEALRGSIRAWLNVLRDGGGEPVLPFPFIH
jgi:predicted metal-dependent hydrolase